MCFGVKLNASKTPPLRQPAKPAKTYTKPTKTTERLKNLQKNGLPELCFLQRPFDDFCVIFPV